MSYDSSAFSVVTLILLEQLVGLEAGLCSCLFSWRIAGSFPKQWLKIEPCGPVSKRRSREKGVGWGWGQGESSRVCDVIIFLE